ncbi:MAG: hypothetical protein JXR65_04915 [Bacteroidales bacterium]|nr:hypothetical protein [Bacteroidales bacterium]
MFHRLSLLFLFVFAGAFSLSAKEKSIDLSPDEIKAYQDQCRQMVDYLQGTLNFLGDPENPSSEKEIIINNSYLKIFKNDKVQIEDDLDEHRDVPLNKDIQAYLKDVVFFFKSVHFTFDIQQIEPMVSPSGQNFFKVSLNRRLQGITVEGDTVDNNEQRFIEINLNPVKNDLKIASIYTHVPNMDSQMKYWWNHLSSGWKQYFGQSIRVYDSIPLAKIMWFSNDSMVIEKKVPVLINDSLNSVDSLSADTTAVYDSLPVQDTMYQIVPDTVPANTRLLTQVLQYLKRTRNIDITGNLNINNLDPLSELSELRSLKAAHTLVDNLTPLRSLNRLEYIDITGCSVTSLSPLLYVSSLKELDASFTQVQKTSVIANLKNLVQLDLSSTRVDSLQQWNNLNQLRSLNLSGTPVQTIDSLSVLTQLTHLNLARCILNSFDPLKALNQLQDLNLDSTNIKNLEQLAGLLSLSTLHINGTQVKDLMPLAGLKNLKLIYCNNSGVTAQEAAKFIKANPSCQVIFNSEKLKSWWDNLPDAWKLVFKELMPKTDSVTVIQLHGLLRIDSLNLSNNKEIRSLKPLEMMSQLDRLNLSSTSISDLFPLSALGNLQYLNLSHTAVSDLSPLSGLKNLKQVHIEYTSVDDLMPLANNSNLSVVYADHSGMSQKSVSTFRNVQPNTLVLFQTDALKKWWNGLSSIWKKVFASQSDLSQNRTAEQLQQLVNKTSLSVSNEMSLNNLEVLHEFKSLEELLVNNTGVTVIAPLTKLKTLKVLRISNSPVSNILPLSVLTDLRELDLENTGVEDLSALQSLRKLQVLNLSGTRVKDLKPLQYLTQLQNLIINNTRIRSLKYVMPLRKIRLLRCDHTSISQKRIDEFKQSHPQAQVIYY